MQRGHRSEQEWKFRVGVSYLTYYGFEMGHLISSKHFGKLSASGSADATKNKQSAADTKEMLKSDQIFLQNKRWQYYYEFSFVLLRPFPLFLYLRAAYLK